MNLWPVEHFFEHICHHFWVGLLFHLLHPPKSDDKYAQKLVRGSSFRSDFIQNPYFKSTFQPMYICKCASTFTIFLKIFNPTGAFSTLFFDTFSRISCKFCVIWEIITYVVNWTLAPVTDKIIKSSLETKVYVPKPAF